MIARVISAFDRSEVRKGDMGRVSIVGGSRLYTGAPFYAARAAVRTGCDLVYIHCDSPSAVPLKTLLPEAIVDPFDEVNKASPTWPWLSSETSKPHVGTFLIGCGLGKESFAREMICRLIRLRTLSGVNIIFDGDALRHSLTPDLLKWMIENPDNNYYLTPNDKEYQHLSLLSDLTHLPNHICLLRKGKDDIIYTTTTAYQVVIPTPGPPSRRPGGMGDLLAGILAAVTSMTSENAKRLKLNPNKDPLIMQANAHLACSILRTTVNDVVYKNYGQRGYNQAFTSFIPQDLLDAIGKNAELERQRFATLAEYTKSQ